MVTQAIILPDEFPQQAQTPNVCWARVVGRDKPMLPCNLINGKSKANLYGMVDTGADVTIVSHAEWPPQWGLEPSEGKVTGFGGSSPSQRSNASILIQGPDGHLVSIQPFVVPSGFTLWGRDLLAQWGTQLEIPPVRDIQ